MSQWPECRTPLRPREPEVDRDVQGDEEADLEAKRFPLAEAVDMVLAGEIVNGPAVSGLLAAHVVVTGGGTSRGPTPAEQGVVLRAPTFAVVSGRGVDATITPLPEPDGTPEPVVPILRSKGDRP